jgi:hypothetical protein
MTFIMARKDTPNEIVNKLRSMALNIDLSDIGLTRTSYPYPVFGLLMETGFPGGSFSLSSFANGSTNLFFSPGGGIIGGKKHKDILVAARDLLDCAQQFFQKARQVHTYPRPQAGEVIFYFISFCGIYSYTASENDLGDNNDALSELFFAAHHVITKLRKLDENFHHKITMYESPTSFLKTTLHVCGNAPVQAEIGPACEGGPKPVPREEDKTIA